VTVTKKQLNHLRKLFMERARNSQAMEIRQHTLALYKEGGLTRTIADEVITTVEALPRDVTQKEVPPGVEPTPGFYLLDDEWYEIERVTEGRWTGYIRVYFLELIDLEDGGTAWERKRRTRDATTRILEQIGA